MTEGGRPGRSESVPSRPAALRESSSKSTPSTNDPQAEHVLRTPATPLTPGGRSPSQTSFRVPPSPRSNVAQPNPESSSKQAKVAIPRLKRSHEGGTGAEGVTKSGGRHRVTHACEPCRHRKTKCSGERPTCRHCADFKIQCFYADGKRDRVKKQFGTLQDKVTEYERILRDLSLRVNESDADFIKTTLDRTAQLDLEDIATERSATIPSISETRDAEESGEESEASGGAGSTGALDRTEEDFTRESARVTGFMGKNSDVTWLQRLRQENKYGEQEESTDPNSARLAEISADDGFSIQDSSYHLNDLAISSFQHVDPYEMPPQEHAQKLFLTYMHRVHPSFPILGRINLQNQFQRFITRPQSRAPPKWLAIVNMVFAIAAIYSHRVQADWRADERDHMIYFSRARELSINADTVFQHPDLQMIQILALMSHYLMAVDQINRAWTVLGLSVRMASALGLNMRNDSANLANELKEIRYRAWWALYVMEHRLCTLTGRVNCVLDEHVTTPLPIPLAEEDFDSELGKKLLDQEYQSRQRAPSSNTHTPSGETSAQSSRSNSKQQDVAQSPTSGQAVSAGDMEWAKEVTPGPALYFLYLVQLARMTQSSFHKLYNPTAIEGTWSDIQRRIRSLDDQLEVWFKSLPATFDFKRKQRDRDYYETRLSLGFFYYATKITIHRPCLCRLDRKLPNQSSKSRHFNHNAAMTCVRAAQDQLDLIPDEPNAVGLLRVGPWTSILHLLVQSATVIMLEISFRAHHMPEQADELIEGAKKAVRWLHALGDENLAAVRAWKLCKQMLEDAARKVGRSIDDMPTIPPRASVPFDEQGRIPADIASQQNVFHQGQGIAQGQGGSFQQTSGMDMHNLGTGMSNYTNAPLFDPFMHYDQFPMIPHSNAMNPSAMAYPNLTSMQFQPESNDVQMNLMDQFTADQHD